MPSLPMPSPSGGAPIPGAASDRESGIGPYLLGRGLSALAIVGVLVLLLAQVLIEVRVARRRPVPPVMARWYPAALHGQVEDVVDWVKTGILLPRSAVPVRAPRPLYPFIVTIAKGVGLFSSIQENDGGRILERGIRILVAANIVFAVAAGWLFFSASRRFGLAAAPAVCATVVALSGRGFSYWTAQAIPEVLTYFASVACLIAGVWAVEAEARGARGWRLAGAWAIVGTLVGIFLLGKELYWLVLMGCLLLAARKSWRALVAFLLTSLLPTAAWLFYVIRAGIFHPADYYGHYGFVTWLFTYLLPAPAPDKIQTLGMLFDLQVDSFLIAFVWIPVLLFCVGVAKWRVPNKQAFLWIFFLSQYLMFTASQFVRSRLMFWTWPVVYFFAWCGVEWLVGRLSRRSGSRALPWIARLAVVVFLVWLQTRPFAHFDFF